MNKNFANWKITQLLPEGNPYVDFDYRAVWASTKEIVPSKYYCNLSGNYDYDNGIRDVWTWEDIRLYLLEKGYELEIIFEIDIEGNQRLYYYNIHFFNSLDEEIDQTMYHSYEEAREAGYIYLLETYIIKDLLK